MSRLMHGRLCLPTLTLPKNTCTHLSIQRPGQSGSDRWLDGFLLLVVPNVGPKGYMVVCVDPRGTGARGEEFRKNDLWAIG